MARVILENISKHFGQVEAVKDFNLTVEDKEFAILVGPSGCGKSTALRMIAGLEEPTAGNITIGDRVVNDLPPKDRDIAIVFQEYALYPHMSVYKNMAFGLRLRRFPKEEIDRRVKEAAEILGYHPNHLRELLRQGVVRARQFNRVWMIDRSGSGDFVVIRASGTDAYNPYIYAELGGVDSCETIILQKKSASYDPFVLEKIQNAEARFIAGGNQWDYVRLWQGTPLEDAIHDVVVRGAPVGGTSAGLAILGEFAFSAQYGTIISSKALKNPYHSHVTLTDEAGLVVAVAVLMRKESA